jgi:hypothetical protein
MYDHKYVLVLDEVQVPLLNCNEVWLFLHKCSINTDIKFHENPSSRSLIVAGG